MPIKTEIKEIRFNKFDIEEFFDLEPVTGVELMPSFFDPEKNQWVVPVKITKHKNEDE